MDRNLIHNQHEPSVWQTLFRPRPHHRVISVSVTQNLVGKQGFPNQQNQCPGSGTSRPRVNLLRLNSQGEDNRSPPILLPSECIFYQPAAEVNFCHFNKEISMKTRINYSKVNSSVNCVECPTPTLTANRRLQNILPASTDELGSIVEEVDLPAVGVQEKMFQRSSLHSSHNNINNISNKLFKFARLSTIMPNENKMQNTEFVNYVPLTRGLPYFRPMIPVGLSASAILFGRYKQAERLIDRTNPYFMQTSMSPENKKKSEISSINSSVSLAKSELAKLINGQKLTMNEQLPQSKQVARSVVEDSISVLGNEMSTDSTNIKSEKIKQTSCEQSKESLSDVSVRQDNDESDDYQKKGEIIPRNLQVHDGQTETENSSCSEVTDLDNNEEENLSDEESDEEEGEYSSSDSDTSGPLSDFESDTESYDASSEYESDCDVHSDTESWASDIKDPVPACQNAIVSFILGQSSDATGGKDSGFDECDEPSIDSSKNQDQVNEDHLWHSLNASGDPYNPINGWKCCSGSSPFKSITPVNQHQLKEQLNNSNHTLPKLNVDDIKPNCLISNDCIIKKDIKLYKDADALVEPNNVVPPGVDKTSCYIIKCLVSCTSSNKTNPNNTVNEINCEDESAATDFVNIARSCFKNKWSRQQEDKQTKKVSFSCKDVSSIAYENPDWCNDYHEMRKPYWESFARDRCRFRRRIKEVSDAISYCFAPNHRNNMMKKLQI